MRILIIQLFVNGLITASFYALAGVTWGVIYGLNATWTDAYSLNSTWTDTYSLKGVS